jgi:hypothetical protein
VGFLAPGFDGDLTAYEPAAFREFSEIFEMEPEKVEGLHRQVLERFTPEKEPFHERGAVLYPKTVHETSPVHFD